MAAGIRVTVEFAAPASCPVAALAERAGATVDDVATSVAADGRPVTEFLVDAGAVPEDCDHDPVFEYADRHLYRVAHADGCPCVCLGEYGTPVDRYFLRDGTLELVFYAADFDLLQAVVGEFRERYPSVDIQRLVRESGDAETRDTVFVDRGRLTDRQFEALSTAYRMGYFRRPRAANASEVAAELGVAPATLHEHLAAAQSKVLGDLLEAGR